MKEEKINELLQRALNKLIEAVAKIRISSLDEENAVEIFNAFMKAKRAARIIPTIKKENKA